MERLPTSHQSLVLFFNFVLKYEFSLEFPQVFVLAKSTQVNKISLALFAYHIIEAINTKRVQEISLNAPPAYNAPVQILIKHVTTY